MNLPSEVFGDIVVVHSPEELGGEQAERLEEALLMQDRKRVVLDLDGTEMLDSRGLTALLNVQDALRAVGGEIKLATANASNRKILEITRLDRQLDVFESVVDAVKSFH
jgi:anti-anti-sigma factor